MKSLFALTGIYQPPLEEGGYTAVPMLCDAASSTLFAFVMFPGAYNDIYDIAAKAKYANIFIVPIGLNAQYITDIHRLVTDLTQIKKCVKVLYPGRYPMPVNSINETAIIRGDSSKCTFTFNNGFIAFDKSFKCNCGCLICGEQKPSATHDILVRYDNISYLLTSTKVNADRIISAVESGSADYVYVPYSYGYVNQENFLTLMKDERLATYHDKIIAYGFRNYEEFEQCYLKYPMSTPMTYRNAFLEDGVGTLYDRYSPVIGSLRFCPSIFYDGGDNTYYPIYKDGNIIATDEEPAKIPADTEDVDFIIEENPDEETYELKSVTLTPGTNVITRSEGIDIPFSVYFTAKRHIKYIDAKTSQESHEGQDVKVAWKDLDVGVYNEDMKYISLKSLTSNFILINGTEAIIGFFNNARSLNIESGSSEIVYEEDEVTIHYYDKKPVVAPPEETDSSTKDDNNENPNPDTKDDTSSSDNGNTDTSEGDLDTDSGEEKDTSNNDSNSESTIVKGPDGIDVT